mmetsp:Transcript_87067/g.266530  ORF Transcript_87067/g.266530 Transcript_87067/m.266530 type:complete len:144 (-) Transcript_87067:66-497(-)
MASAAGRVEQAGGDVGVNAQGASERSAYEGPGNHQRGQVLLRTAENQEALNRRRGDFPAYARACRSADERAASVRRQLSAGVQEDFPLYAAAVQERKAGSEWPAYKAFSAMTVDLVTNQPYCALHGAREGAHASYQIEQRSGQ